jgi:hypothetical protein
MKLKMKDMPILFTFCLLSLKSRMKRLNSSRQRSRSFEMKSTYSKVNKPNLRFVALKRMKTFLLKKRDEIENIHREKNLNLNWTK